MHFDHAGIATEDATSVADRFTDLCGLEVAHEERFQGMDVVFLDCGNGYLELLEPLADGPIANYLEANGAGIQHLALATDDLSGALERARELNVRLIDEEPRPGAWGHSVAFCHPKDTGGVLLEFVEH